MYSDNDDDIEDFDDDFEEESSEYSEYDKYKTLDKEDKKNIYNYKKNTKKNFNDLQQIGDWYNDLCTKMIKDLGDLEKEKVKNIEDFKKYLEKKEIKETEEKAEELQNTYIEEMNKFMDQKIEEKMQKIKGRKKMLAIELENDLRNDKEKIEILKRERERRLDLQKDIAEVQKKMYEKSKGVKQPEEYQNEMNAIWKGNVENYYPYLFPGLYKTDNYNMDCYDRNIGLLGGYSCPIMNQGKVGNQRNIRKIKTYDNKIKRK